MFEKIGRAPARRGSRDTPWGLVRFACLTLALVLVAEAAQGQPPPATDAYGDPLPPGAVARLGTVRFRHNGTLAFATFLPDSKGVLVVGKNGSVCVWEFPSGKEIRRFGMPSGSDESGKSAARITSASLSPDGKRLTTFGTDGLIRVWDWANARLLGEVVNRVGATGLVDPDSAGSPFSKAKAKAAAAAAGIRGPVYSPDGKTLMLTGSSPGLQFVDLATGKEIGPSLGDAASLTSIRFASDGRQVVTRTARTTQTWDAATGKSLGTVAVRLPPDPGSPTILSPDGRVGVAVERFATAATARVAKMREAILFDTATGKEIGRIELEIEATPLHRKPLQFSPDGKLLAACLGTARTGKERIALYAVPNGKLLRTLETDPGVPAVKGAKGVFAGKAGPGFGVVGLASRNAQKLLFSADGKVLAFQASPGTPITLLDTATGRTVSSLHPAEGVAPVLHGAFLPDGRCLALEESDGTVTLYELATGELRHTYGGKWLQKGKAAKKATKKAARENPFADVPIGQAGAETPSLTFAVSPDGKLLVRAGAARTLHVVDVVTGQELAVLAGHTGAINAVAFAPHGKTLASASADTTALIWDVTRIKRPTPPARTARPGELEAWWQALAAKDAGKAWAALGGFVGAPRDAAAFLKARLEPAAPLDRKHLGELIGQLDHAQFKVRDRATRELLRLGDRIVPELDRALAAGPSAESQSRLEELRAKLTAGGLAGAALRAFRAVEVLEHLGTPEAREMLQTLANGAPDALVTRSARAALER